MRFDLSYARSLIYIQQDGGGTRGVATLEFMKKLEEVSGKRVRIISNI